MQNIDWNAKEAIARNMTDADLHYARLDCVKTAQVMGTGEMIGKDAAYYMDEASIYARELDRRRKEISRK